MYIVVSGTTAGAGVKRATPKLTRDLECIKCEGNIGEAAGRKRSHVMKWKQ